MTSVEVETTRGTADAGATAPDKTGAPATREVRHEYTPTLPSLLSQLGVSLLVSTYQAGKVVAVGVAQGELTLSYHKGNKGVRTLFGGLFGGATSLTGARASVVRTEKSAMLKRDEPEFTDGVRYRPLTAS